MIKILNPDRLTQQPFFISLINYLLTHQDVTLRQIKQDFPEVEQIERSLEAYIQAGYVLRSQRRYQASISLLKDAKSVQLDEQVFVDEDSPVYQALLAREFETCLTNQTNQVVLIERTDFERQALTLSNYFHKLQTNQPLTPEQRGLYEILGDVNPEYALKYMTSFLLKFLRKDLVKQKRRDIFVESLVYLGYLQKEEEGTYSLAVELDGEQMIFSKP